MSTNNYRYPVERFGPWQEQEFVIVATCLKSKYKDIKIIIADSKETAKEEWKNENSKFGIDVEARYGEKIEVLDGETFDKCKQLLVLTPNSLKDEASNTSIGKGQHEGVIPWSHATKSERRQIHEEALEPKAWEENGFDSEEDYNEWCKENPF